MSPFRVQRTKSAREGLSMLCPSMRSAALLQDGSYSHLSLRGHSDSAVWEAMRRRSSMSHGKVRRGAIDDDAPRGVCTGKEEEPHHFFSRVTDAKSNATQEAEQRVAAETNASAQRGEHETAFVVKSDLDRVGSKKNTKKDGRIGRGGTGIRQTPSGRPETLKDVIDRKGSLKSGYIVLDRMQNSGGRPLTAKFFSMLMKLCVANIRVGRATLADAYAVMQRSRTQL